MPGPAPNPYSRRSQKSNSGITTLPAEGYDGPVPDWPLLNDPSDAELGLWASLWGKPQAVVWARDGSERVVARYVMVTILAEDPSSPSAALLAEVRQMEDRLGLSPMAMKRLMWEVGDKSDRRAGLAEVKSIDRFADL